MTTKQVRIKKKIDNDDWAQVCPETSASVVTFSPDNTFLISTDIQSAVEELDNKITSIDNSTVKNINNLRGDINIVAGHNINIDIEDNNISISTAATTTKQDTLIAGEGIEITDDNIINALDLTIDEPILVTRSVGGYEIGDEIEVGTKLVDIIKQILHPTTSED